MHHVTRKTDGFRVCICVRPDRGCMVPRTDFPGFQSYGGRSLTFVAVFHTENRTTNARTRENEPDGN